MRKISELQQEEAIEVLGEIIDPLATIFADKEVIDTIRGNGTKVQAINIVCRKYASELIDIMAAVDGVPRSEYKVNIFTLPVAVMAIINDEELKDFFTSQVVGLIPDISTSPAEPTTDTEA